MRKELIGSPAWITRESFNGMPTSAVTVPAISSARASSPSAIARSSRWRSDTAVADQPSKAARAAATARRASSAVPAGIVPSSSPVPASTTSSVPLPSGVAQAPST